MRHYRIAIVAPVEYRADNPVWRCFEDLRLAGHAVELLDPRRFHDIIDEHGAPDLRVLAPFLERFRPDCVTDGSEGAEAVLARLEGTGAGSDEPARRFVVFGYVGPDNFGDELIFSVVCDQIERRFPGAHIQLIGHDPAATLARHGVVSVTCDQKLEADVMMRGASALVYMAGIMFDDPFAWWTAGPVDPFLNPRSEIGGQAAFAVMASLYGVPPVFLGIGAGPLSNPDARRLVRLEARCGARYLPRDRETERLLLEAGVPASRVSRKADLAFLIDRDAARGAASELMEANGLSDGGYLVVALREHRTVPEGFADAVARALTAICSGRGLDVALVEFSPEDRPIHEAVAARLGAGVRSVSVSTRGPVGRTIDLIARSRAVVAMRLHCSIVANACGVPSLGFDYNEKIAGFYELMGREDALLPMGAGADDVAAAYERMEAHRDDDLRRIQERARACRALAEQAVDELQAAVEAAEPLAPEPRVLYPRSVSIEEQRLHEVERELGAVTAERDAARAELERVRSSTTWRVGSALTALPRALKRARDGRR